MYTILVSAYDVDPFKGSESGSGWNFILQIARFNKVIAITRKNNRAAIELFVKDNNISIENITFFYFDLPNWAMFWKRGPRFSRVYFYLWQMCLPIYVSNQIYQFDLAHNLNFHTDSVPTFLWVLRRPTVWGPINHNEPVNYEYLTKLEYFKDRLQWFGKRISWTLDPFHWIARRSVTFIIGANSSVKYRLDIPDNKFLKMSTIAAKTPSVRQSHEFGDYFNVAVIGRQIPIKSTNIAILSFNEFYIRLNSTEKSKVKLYVLGEGVQHQRLRILAESLASSASIEFVPWIDHSEMDKFYMTVDCLLNCSHEGAGAIVAEALSYGLPMICFNNYGPGEAVDDSCSLKVNLGPKHRSIVDFAEKIDLIFRNKKQRERLSAGAFGYFDKELTWDTKGLKLQELYYRILERNGDV